MAVAMMAGLNPQPIAGGLGLGKLRFIAGDRAGARPSPLPPQDIRVPVASDSDVVAARQTGRMLTMRAGFSSADATIVATAISELARNIVLYATRGEIVLAVVSKESRTGVRVTARDEGPGIRDVNQAMQDGYSSGGRLGVGLPGVRRLMDEFLITSQVGRGTIVTATKWKLG